MQKKVAVICKKCKKIKNISYICFNKICTMYCFLTKPIPSYYETQYQGGMDGPPLRDHPVFTFKLPEGGGT